MLFAVSLLLIFQVRQEFVPLQDQDAGNDGNCIGTLLSKGVNGQKAGRRCGRHNGFGSANMRLRLEPAVVFGSNRFQPVAALVATVAASRGAAPRPAARPEKMQPPTKVPSSDR